MRAHAHTYTLQHRGKRCSPVTHTNCKNILLHIRAHHDSLSRRVDRKSHRTVVTMSKTIQVCTHTHARTHMRARTQSGAPSSYCQEASGRQRGRGCCEDMLNACEVGVFVKERGRRGRGECAWGGGEKCSISHRPTAAAFSAEREKEEGGLHGVRRCVCSVFR